MHTRPNVYLFIVFIYLMARRFCEIQRWLWCRACSTIFLPLSVKDEEMPPRRLVPILWSRLLFFHLLSLPCRVIRGPKVCFVRSISLVVRQRLCTCTCLIATYNKEFLNICSCENAILLLGLFFEVCDIYFSGWPRKNLIHGELKKYMCSKKFEENGPIQSEN